MLQVPGGTPCASTFGTPTALLVGCSIRWSRVWPFLFGSLGLRLGCSAFGSRFLFLWFVIKEPIDPPSTLVSLLLTTQSFAGCLLQFSRINRFLLQVQQLHLSFLATFIFGYPFPKCLCWIVACPFWAILELSEDWLPIRSIFLKSEFLKKGWITSFVEQSSIC